MREKVHRAVVDDSNYVHRIGKSRTATERWTTSVSGRAAKVEITSGNLPAAISAARTDTADRAIRALRSPARESPANQAHRCCRPAPNPDCRPKHTGKTSRRNR